MPKQKIYTLQAPFNVYLGAANFSVYHILVPPVIKKGFPIFEKDSNPLSAIKTVIESLGSGLDVLDNSVEKPFLITGMNMAIQSQK
jgi:hypothetical protein